MGQKNGPLDRRTAGAIGAVWLSEADRAAIAATGLVEAMALAMVLRRIGINDATVHGFRSCFRDWAGNRTNYPRELAEHALAHVSGDKAEQAYRRDDALERRRPLMQAWERYCSQLETAKVLKLTTGRSLTPCICAGASQPTQPWRRLTVRSRMGGRIHAQCTSLCRVGVWIPAGRGSCAVSCTCSI